MTTRTSDCKLRSGSTQCQIIHTCLFSSDNGSTRLTLPRRFLSCLLFRSLCFNRASCPVVKSANKRWTKKSPPARGQIESEVVADVRVPSTGERRDKRRGGRIKGRRGVGGGNKSKNSLRLLESWIQGTIHTQCDIRTSRLHLSPSPLSHEVPDEAEKHTRPPDFSCSEVANK